MRPPRSIRFTSAVLLFTVAACGDTVGRRADARANAAGDSLPMEAGMAAASPMPAMAARADAAASMVARRAVAPREAGDMGAVQTLPAARVMDASMMLIRTASASVEVTALDPAVEAARQAAARFGGVVANAQLSTGRNENHRAVLQLKVPAARFDSLLSGLSPLGRVESVAVNAQDVGEEYVDIEARLVNLHRLEARLIDLLANRTGKLTDVLSVEHELARVRGEIEQIEGRRRFLQRSIALSTIELTLHEPVPIIAGTPGSNPIAEAVRDAWRNFVALVAWGIASLGVAVPVTLLVAAVVVVARRARRQHLMGLTGASRP